MTAGFRSRRTLLEEEEELNVDDDEDDDVAEALELYVRKEVADVDEEE